MILLIFSYVTMLLNQFSQLFPKPIFKKSQQQLLRISYVFRSIQRLVKRKLLFINRWQFDRIRDTVDDRFWKEIDILLRGLSESIEFLGLFSVIL
jgi:hypothetical protein